MIRLPSYEQVKSDPVLYAHANRVLHLETNPGNARALVQAHGEGATARDVWLNPPPIPLTTAEMDWVFGLPYARSPHPQYADETGSHDGATKIPAWEMIRASINIMRGCFGGCTFCSITEHEGRIIQSRSEASILQEVEDIRDKVAGFTGTISDLGGPTANMYRLGCRSPEIEAACRKPSCVFPGICQNLTTDHGPLIRIYRRARALKGIKKILIGSGLRYDLAVQSPEYVKELVQHHVGGYLKIAPEHTEEGPLSKMMKPGIGNYDRFKQLFEKFSEEAGKKQFLIPYFIAAHPGTSDEDMMHLALWLKKNGFRADQVQTFYPSPMATATAMYHTGRNTLTRVRRRMRDEAEESVDIVRGEKRRRLHKAFLRYHDPNNWPLLREALKSMGRADLIGNGKHHLIPTFQPMVDGSYQSARRKNSTSAKGGGGVGYAINKDGKPVALRRRPEEPQEQKDDVRFRSSAPSRAACSPSTPACRRGPARAARRQAAGADARSHRLGNQVLDHQPAVIERRHRPQGLQQRAQALGRVAVLRLQEQRMRALARMLCDTAHDHALRAHRGQRLVGVAQRAHHVLQDGVRRSVGHVVAALRLQGLAGRAGGGLVREQGEHIARGVERSGGRGHAGVEGEGLHGGLQNLCGYPSIEAAGARVRLSGTERQPCRTVPRRVRR